MKILALGDVAGRVGRVGMAKALPQLREEYQADVVIVNVENMSHGRGISPDTMDEALSWGADCYTTGDHAWDNELGLAILDDKNIPIVRPANYGDGVPGRGWHIVQSGAWSIAVINLQGQLGFRSIPDNPFLYVDELLSDPKIAQSHIQLIDFHAEFTSEKRGFGWHVDGRVSGVWGTHTHIPTADAQIIPNGTGYISDVGMCGAYDSIIGMDKSGPLRMFKTKIKAKMNPPDEGPAEIGAVLFDIDPQNGKASRIEHIRRIVE